MTMTKHARLSGLLAVTLLSGMIAGCSQSAPEPEAPVETNEALEPPVSPDPVPVIENAPEPAPEPANVVALPPEEPKPADVQMMDDADATGMTARLPDEEPDNQNAAPVEGQQAQ